MKLTAIVLGYSTLCVVVAFFLNRKGNSFRKFLLWSFCVSPLGGIILALKEATEDRRRTFSLKK